VIGDTFTPDTTVAMADGSSKPISELRPGDLVEAYDPATGKTGPHTVTAVTVNRDPATEHLVLDTGPIETTPNHPFYTTDRGWVEAGALRIGERIRTATGTDATVVSFTLDAHPASMWDITVAGAHSFFVGSGAALVHNCPRPLGGKDTEPMWTRLAGLNPGFGENAAVSDAVNSGFGSMSRDAAFQPARTIRTWAWRAGAGFAIGSLLWTIAHGGATSGEPEPPHP